MSSSKKFLVSLLLAISFSLSYAPATIAEGNAIHKMAQIVMHLNHYPSEGDKTKLKTIAAHGTEAEKTIANALMHMSHKISAADKKKLEQVSHDNSLSAHTRELAMIIHNINHKVSAGDKKKLGKM